MDYVTTLFQDSRGYIWMGTFFGLNRFDGAEIKAYRPNMLDPWALYANNVHYITEDQQGLLWIGTEKGLAIMDPVTERILHLNQLNDSVPLPEIRKLLIDQQQRVWLYLEHKDGIELLGIQSDARLKADIRAGKRNRTFTLHSIRLPIPPRVGINAFLQTGASSCTLFDSEGSAYSVDLRAERAIRTTISEVSQPITADIRLIPNPTTPSGTLLFSNHLFQNGIHADQMHAYHTLADGRVLLFHFFDPHIYLLPNIHYLRQIKGTDPWAMLPVLTELEFPTTFSRLIDRNGDIWVGTTGSGVCQIRLPINGITQRAAGQLFYNMAPLPDNLLWTGYFSPEKTFHLGSGQIQSTPWQPLLQSGDQTISVLPLRRASTALLLVRDSRTQKLKGYQYTFNKHRLQSIPLTMESAGPPPIMLEDNKGDIWISGNSGALLQFSPGSRQLKKWSVASQFPPDIAAKLSSQDMLQATDGTIWVAHNFGLVKISRPEGANPSFQAYHNYGKKHLQFANNGLFAIQQDPYNPQILWLGTIGNGLAQFDISTETVHYLPQDDGLNHPIVLAMEMDAQQHLWLSTDQGITCFDPKTQQFIRYDLPVTVEHLRLNATSSTRLPDGTLLFGGANSLLSLNPEKISQQIPSTQRNQVHIQKIEVNALSMDTLLSMQKLRFSKDETMHLSLQHAENNLYIAFAAPGVRHSAIPHYRYKIMGLSDQWVYIKNQPQIWLTGLPPGKFELVIQVASPDNLYHPSQIPCLTISISPPWYLSRMAIAAYILLFGLLIVAYFLFERRKLIQSHLETLNARELHRLQSLDTFKNKFFAYLAHEIKTPLSIIRGILDNFRPDMAPENFKSFTRTIEYESNNLLSIVDEMMDISRLQEGNLHLNYHRGDLVSFLQNRLHSFKALAEFQKIELCFEANQVQLTMDFDHERLKHLLNNLLGNALRHTPVAGKISLRAHLLSDEQVAITISDTGEGIAPEDIPFIFDRYFQGNKASATGLHFGLGLSYVKDLVDLMNGSVSVQSTRGEGTQFQVLLPRFSPHRNPSTESLPIQRNNLAELPVQQLPERFSMEHALPLLLIVEDNPMLSSLLKLSLQPHYKILLARNGREGLDIALREIPDLVLTDLIMPEMDGITMIQQIRINQLTAHIPIVVLSTKTDMEDRLSGQAFGANAYIGKPFDTRELLLALHSLYDLQSRWKVRYAPPLPPDSDALPADPALNQSMEPAILQATDDFMRLVYQVFETHYSSETFDVQQLCRALHMSKAQLYRKLSALSDQGPMEMLREFRLDKAMQLLRANPNLRTAEVATMVGFKERSYFSTQFKRKFHTAPSDFKKNGGE